MDGGVRVLVRVITETGRHASFREFGPPFNPLLDPPIVLPIFVS